MYAGGGPPNYTAGGGGGPPNVVFTSGMPMRPGGPVHYTVGGPRPQAMQQQYPPAPPPAYQQQQQQAGAPQPQPHAPPPLAMDMVDPIATAKVLIEKDLKEALAQLMRVAGEQIRRALEQSMKRGGATAAHSASAHAAAQSAEQAAEPAATDGSPAKAVGTPGGGGVHAQQHATGSAELETAASLQLTRALDHLNAVCDQIELQLSVFLEGGRQSRAFERFSTPVTAQLAANKQSTNLTSGQWMAAMSQQVELAAEVRRAFDQLAGSLHTNAAAADGGDTECDVG